VTNQDWGNLSDQAIAFAGVVYFVALIVHLVEWASLRERVTAEPAATEVDHAAEAAEAADGGGVAVVTGGPLPEPTHRVAFLGRLGFLLTVIALGIHLLGLISRGMAADPNRVPWGNMYEFTIAGSFVVTLLYVGLNRKYKLGWMAPIVLSFVLAALMVAVIWLHEEVAPLTEALNSYWLVIHVVSAILATGAFTLGGIVSAMYLIKSRKGDTTGGPLSRVPSLDALDKLSYRIHAFGFPVWTFAVLITGPIWAHEAWSSYWNWDPKEVWAFITWVVYAGYLHARATAGWRGRNAALLALLGLATLWFNFIGINYFSSTSQHSYASPAIVVVEVPVVEQASR
jgi:cytochrome c-type biogenesis protein CcsB